MGRFVLMRIYLFLLAFVVLGLAIQRVIRTITTREKTSAENSRNSSAFPPKDPSPKIYWRSKGVLSVPLAHIEGLPLPSLRRGDEVVLLQSLSSGELCSVGSFIFLESQPSYFTFKSLQGRRLSQLENWARQTGSALKWQIIRPNLESGVRPYVQKCERWLLVGESLEGVKMVASRRKIFLSSKEFVRVWPLPSARSVLVEPDLIRGGWYVSSPDGGLQRLVVVGAQTGIKQELTVQFPTFQPKTPRVPGDYWKGRNKPLALPGWD